MAELPQGIVTFMFTDVEGSTRLWEDAPDSMMRALEQHDAVIDGAVSAHNGVSVKPRGEGDSRFVVFASAVDALSAAADMQRGLSAIKWVTPRPLKVRASLHSGMADLQAGDYYGSAVNRAARIRAVAQGGQTIMSGSTWELVQDSLPDGVQMRDMGIGFVVPGPVHPLNGFYAVLWGLIALGIGGLLAIVYAHRNEPRFHLFGRRARDHVNDL